MDSTSLELLIDKVGLFATLDMVADICHQKAEHIRSNWQDDITAKTWDRFGRKIETCRASLSKNGVNA